MAKKTLPFKIDHFDVSITFVHFINLEILIFMIAVTLHKTIDVLFTSTCFLTQNVLKFCIKRNSPVILDVS